MQIFACKDFSYKSDEFSHPVIIFAFSVRSYKSLLSLHENMADRSAYMGPGGLFLIPPLISSPLSGYSTGGATGGGQSGGGGYAHEDYVSSVL